MARAKVAPAWATSGTGDSAPRRDSLSSDLSSLMSDMVVDVQERKLKKEREMVSFGDEN